MKTLPARCVDPQPSLGPGERLDRAELATLAVSLLSQLARHDPAIAEKMRERGIDVAYHH